MQTHWPHWIRIHAGAIPSYSTVDYAARKAINALRVKHPDARLVDLGDNDLWLLIPDGDYAVDCYPTYGGERVRFLRVGDRLLVCGRSNGGSRCSIKPLRAAILRHLKELAHV